ncbi:MAG: hypothetical protein ACD_49C00045G0002 [uncultured bacterium (gcode 4)]|uniref:Peptidyl-prolyl cis-trans isomerase n=1 Tax=uncultured bacterium (gcode 4) TaxID=1234023 RepID=K2BC65_9BACT|nr:MAG: hypothetical protein ACD_49C00045G0002 [uncultured bacterium (gcode 4)]
MKKVLAILTVAPLILTSCFNSTENTKTQTLDTNSEKISDKKEEVKAKKEVVSSGDTVGVDYVGTLEDGTVFDSSLEEFAKKTKNYSPDSGRKYEPLSFTVGAGQMIKGFDAGVVGMKLGEKKTLVLAPADAYGEAFTEQEVPVKYFQDVFSETVPRENFKDTVTQTVPMSALGEKGNGLTVGQVIEAGSVQAKVTKIEGDNVTVDIDNAQNPFYGKKMAVGLKATFEGNAITVTKLTDTEVTLKVVNKANPFYGKKIKEGMEGTMPNGSKMKILKITKETITIGVPNTHELAGKTLKFDVEVKSIK